MILVGQYDSPYVRRVAVSLRVLGLPYEHDIRSVFGDFDSMRRTNPLGRIPSLILDGGECTQGIESTILALRVRDSHGTYTGVLAGIGVYVVVMVVAGVLMPTVNEVGDFPADTLWYFRRDSLITSATSQTAES